MNRLCVWLSIVALAAMLVAGTSLADETVAADETVTVVGKVNDEYQLVTAEGKVYDLGAIEESEDVLDKLVEEEGKKVSVEGIVEMDGEGGSTLYVVSYEVVEAQPLEDAE